MQKLKRSTLNEQTTRGKKGKANSSKSLTVNLLGAAQWNSQLLLFFWPALSSHSTAKIGALLKPKRRATADTLPVARRLMWQRCCGTEAGQSCVSSVFNLISCDWAREKKHSELLQISAKHFEMPKDNAGYRAACWLYVAQKQLLSSQMFSWHIFLYITALSPNYLAHPFTVCCHIFLLSENIVLLSLDWCLSTLCLPFYLT